MAPGSVSVQHATFAPKDDSPQARAVRQTKDGEQPDGWVDSFDTSSAQADIYSCAVNCDICALSSVGGNITVDVTNGSGWASVYGGAKADVSYGVLCHSQDEKGVAIATATSPVASGASLQLFGFGGGFNCTVTPDAANATSATLNGADAKQWVHSNSASAVVEAHTYGNIHLTGKPSGGKIEGLAFGGTMVAFRIHVAPTEE
ncbi:hypothetical protein LBMAG49_31690 [Planctomycetota bacterium]|nr:hypothetical protein LBMAG49_31690 [Planctomycetota bacterium]